MENSQAAYIYNILKSNKKEQPKKTFQLSELPPESKVVLAVGGLVLFGSLLYILTSK